MNIPVELETLHVDDLRNGAHPSIFDVNKHYDMLIIRLPSIDHQLLELKSTGFIIAPNRSYVYDPNMQAFIALEDRFLEMYRRIDAQADALMHQFEGYKETIETMQDTLYTNRIPKNFMNTWLKLKRDILRIERTLARATHTMDALIAHYEPLETFPINHYADIHEHLDRTMHSAILQLGKLDYIYNFFNTQSDEKLNRMIYILTVISVIFLPLNLIVGFFGMNTSNLPFSQGSFGTQAVLLGMTVIAVLGILGFWWWKKRQDPL